MNHYVITTDLVRPHHAEACFGAFCKDFGGADSRTEAVWLTKFGIPNQVMLLQGMTESGALPPAPMIPAGVELMGRSRDIVSAIRPFPHRSDRAMCELRIYDIAEDQGEAFLERKCAILPVRERYSPNFGVFVSVTGRSFRVMHLWGYASVEERDAVRGKLKGDPLWQAYIAEILPMLVGMQSTLITPVSRPAGAS